MEKPKSDSEYSEIQHVTEKFARLSTSNVREYFRGVRVILDELNAEQNRIQEQLCYMHEHLPHQLSRIRLFREQLFQLKHTIVTALKNYRYKQQQLWIALKQNAPDVHGRLERVVQQMKELNYLKVAHSLAVTSYNIRKAMNTSNFVALCDYIQTLEQSYFDDLALDESEAKEIAGKRRQVLCETEQIVFCTVKSLLRKIHYPFEEAIDLKINQKAIHEIAALLKCIGFLDNGIVNIHCDRTRVMDELTVLLEKRFHYHFFTEQKTNNPSKPEWFFTQILNWIAANIDFVSAILQHVFDDKAERSELVHLFVDKLISLGKKKVQNIRDDVADDPELFSHLIDECVAFENELQDIAVPVRPGDILAVLCEDVYLVKWLQLERESCIAGVENVLSSEDCWANRYHGFSDIDTHQVPECTDQFLVMIESITERYRCIDNLDVQSQFLNVQIFMLDDFRLRLVQISQQLSTPWQKPFIQILNSAWYIAYVLDEWNEVDIFIRIQALGKRAHFRGVFEDVANMYRHLWRQRAQDLSSAFYQHISATLSRYEREHWYSWEAGRPHDLTPSFCPFLLEVRRLLGHVNDAISPHSAAKLYEMLNEKVAEVLLQMVTTISLNGYGAAQILFDLTNSLMPVLNALYSHHFATVNFEVLDEPKFAEVISYLKILSQSTGTAILLYEELKTTGDDMTPSLLEPFDASTVERERALELLRHRSDLHLSNEEVVKL